MSIEEIYKAYRSSRDSDIKTGPGRMGHRFSLKSFWIKAASISVLKEEEK